VDTHIEGDSRTLIFSGGGVVRELIGAVGEARLFA
jgi:hypothetical protein